MTAFNDYCIVCDQLILQQSPNTKQKLACKNKKHDCNGDRQLYCSESCQLKDKHSIHASLESLDVRDNSGTLDEEDSLITSPLLLPMDYKTANGIGENDADDDASIYCLMNMESANTIAIPRSSTYQRTSPSRSEMCFDHIAENNYKLWLNQRQ